MKTSFKYLLVASMLAIGFTSCSKDDDVNNGGGEYDGERSALQITIVNPPSTYAYDPTDAESLDEEALVKTAYVSFFNPTNKQHVETFYTDITTGSGPTTIMVENAPIGNYDIYVGLNLAKGASGSRTSLFDVDLEDAFKADGIYAVNEIKKTGNYRLPSDLANTTDGFAMFSANVKNATIIDGENKVAVEVARMVAKVAPKEKQNLEKENITGVKFFDLQFAIGQANTKIYAYQNVMASGYVTDPNYGGQLLGNNSNVIYWEDFYNEFRPDRNPNSPIVSGAFIDVNAHNTIYKDLKVKYAPENTSTSTSYKGEVTYVSVKAEFMPMFLSTYDKDTQDPQDIDPVADPSHTTFTAKTYYVVRPFYEPDVYTHEYYFFLDEDEAKDFYAALGGADYASYSTYKNGLCYYPVFLNKDNTSGGKSTGYDILRNEFYELTINSIKGLGNPDPEIPDPWNPIGGDADLEVEVTILDWKVVKENVDLDI